MKSDKIFISLRLFYRYIIAASRLIRIHSTSRVISNYFIFMRSHRRLHSFLSKIRRLYRLLRSHSHLLKYSQNKNVIIDYD